VHADGDCGPGGGDGAVAGGCRGGGGGGAAYLVAPDLRPEVVAWAVERGVPVVPGALTPTEVAGAWSAGATAGKVVPVWPGALTPTEVAAAWAAGATAVKVFPVSAVGGPAYLKAVRAPLPEVPLMPTGGVGIDDIGAYLAAGAAAVGVVAPLLGDS